MVVGETCSLYHHIIIAVGTGLLVSQVAVWWGIRGATGACTERLDRLSRVLTSEQRTAYQKVYEQRLRISIISAVLALLFTVGVSSIQTITWSLRITLFLSLYLLFYLLWPKTQSMVSQLTRQTQMQAWWAVYQCMQRHCLWGFVTGIVLYTLWSKLHGMVFKNKKHKGGVHH